MMLIGKKYKIENIVHLAAQVSVSYSFKDKIYDAQNNIICSIKLCNLAKKYDVKKMIVSSTAAVYGAPERLPIDEEHPVSCQSPYAISKYSMEEYLRISSLDYIVCRFSNVYGPRQDTQGEAGVIAIFADKISKNEEIEIHGDGQQIRDFIFVKDVAFAIQKCIEKDVKNQTINISTNTQCTINELFENLKEIASYTKTPKYTEERIGDIKISVLDNSKAKALLDWDCQAEFKKGLKETIEYLRDYKID